MLTLTPTLIKKIRRARKVKEKLVGLVVVTVVAAGECMSYHMGTHASSRRAYLVPQFTYIPLPSFFFFSFFSFFF